MQSFINSPEIQVLISQRDLSSHKKSKKLDDTPVENVEFSKREEEILKKIETINFEENFNENDENNENDKATNKKGKGKQTPLTLQELKNLKQQLGDEIFLCDLINDLDLPQNEIVERNPVLEARIKKLKAQQANKEYDSMTRNVDSSRKNVEPTDSIAFQSE
jgi:hypothetical protein